MATDISTLISQITTDRNTIRTKLTDLGLATATSKLTDCATAIDGIVNCGSVTASVTEGSTYSIPKGYHDGSGTVSGVKGGGNYSLQSKTVTPTKAQQAITPDSGYYGLSDVTVKAIPDNYQDVSSVDATAADVLANKKIVTADGTLTAGTMTNNGTITKTLSTSTTSYTIPKGYHSGSGKVSITTETKTVTPIAEASQAITPSSGKVLSQVVVNAIPVKYADVTDTTAIASDVLTGRTIVIPKKGTDGTVTGTETIEGTMVANAASATKLTTTSTSWTVPQGYHTGLGSVSIDLEEKSATPTESAQTITSSTGKVLSKVTVGAIPSKYKDISGVTATADTVLDGSSFVASDGTTVEGTIPVKGEIIQKLNRTTTSWVIPEGYYNGKDQMVQADVITSSVTPSKEAQTVTGGTYLLSAVSVSPIPDKYQDVTEVTATAASVLDGFMFVNSSGEVVEGTIVNHGIIGVNKELDGMTATSVSIPKGFYPADFTVSLTSSIEEALAAI